MRGKIQYIINGQSIEVVEARMEKLEPAREYLEDLLEVCNWNNQSRIKEIIEEMLSTGKKASVVVSERG